MFVFPCLFPLDPTFPYTYLLYKPGGFQWDLNSGLSPGPHEKNRSRWDMVGQRPLDHSPLGPPRHRYDFHQEWLYRLPSPFGWSDPHIQHLKQECIKLSFLCPLSTQGNISSGCLGLGLGMGLELERDNFFKCPKAGLCWWLHNCLNLLKVIKLP